MKNKDAKRIIFCGISNYKVTADGNVPYTPSEQEKEDFKKMMVKDAPADAVIVVLDENSFGEFWQPSVFDSNPLQKLEPEIKPALTDAELRSFNLDENDLSLIRIIKNKLVKMQLYETAVKVRDLEKHVMLMIDYAQEKKGNKGIQNQSDSIEFALYLSNHFIPFRLTNGKIKGYSKIEEKINSEIDAEVKIYKIDEVYNFYQMHRVREALTEK